MITALFDGQCAICQTTRYIIQRLDWFQRVDFLDLHNQALVQERFPHLNYADMMGEIHIISSNDNIYGGFAGIRRMIREVPLGFPIWLLLFLPGINWLGPKAYALVARNRYTINRLLGIELGDDCIDGVCKLPQ